MNVVSTSMLLNRAIFQYFPAVPRCPTVIHPLMHCLLRSLHDNHNPQSCKAHIISDAIKNRPGLLLLVSLLLVLCHRKALMMPCRINRKFTIATLKFGSCLTENPYPSVLLPYASLCDMYSSFPWNIYFQ